MKGMIHVDWEWIKLELLSYFEEDIDIDEFGFNQQIIIRKIVRRFFDDMIRKDKIQKVKKNE